MGRRAIDVGPVGANVARNVNRLRRANGHTTRELAYLLAEYGKPIPAPGISRIESRQRRVDVDDLVALATVLNVVPSHLLADPETLYVSVEVRDA